MDIEGVLKTRLHKAAQSVGIAVGRFPSVDSLQGHLKSFFRLTGINCVLDVGAHKGEYRDALREIAYRNRIVSFEPVAANFDGLAAKARADANWQVHKLALGSTPGTQEINIYRGSVFNSFLSSSAYAQSRFGAAVERAGSEVVEVRRLDQVLGECLNGIDRPKVFLKMDTQGWDMEVLRGASGVLSQILGIQSELPVQRCYEGMSTYTQMLEQYAQLGFDITGIYPVTRDRDDLRVVEFDCVMRNRMTAHSGLG